MDTGKPRPHMPSLWVIGTNLTILRASLANLPRADSNCSAASARYLPLSTMNSTVTNPLAGIVTNCAVGLNTSVGVTVT